MLLQEVKKLYFIVQYGSNVFCYLIYQTVDGEEYLGLAEKVIWWGFRGRGQEAGGRRRDYDDLKEGEVQVFRDITLPFLALFC